MEIKPRLRYSYLKIWVCFSQNKSLRNIYICECGMGKTFQEAYKDWKLKQEREVK